MAHQLKRVTLEQSSDLNPTDWFGVTNFITTAGTNYSVTITTTNTREFFRLAHP